MRATHKWINLSLMTVWRSIQGAMARGNTSAGLCGLRARSACGRRVMPRPGSRACSRVSSRGVGVGRAFRSLSKLKMRNPGTLGRKRFSFRTGDQVSPQRAPLAVSASCCTTRRCAVRRVGKSRRAWCSRGILRSHQFALRGINIRRSTSIDRLNMSKTNKIRVGMIALVLAVVLVALASWMEGRLIMY